MTHHDLIVEAARKGAVLRYQSAQAATRQPFRASSIAGCQRKLVLLADPAVEPLPLSEKSVLTLDHGTLRGAEMVDNLKVGLQAITDTAHPLYGAEVMHVEREVTIPVPGEWSELELHTLSIKLPELGLDRGRLRPYIVGHIDFVLQTKEGMSIVVDWKTAHPFSWKSKRAEAKEGKGDEGYMTQLGLYMIGLQRWQWHAQPDALHVWGDPCLVYESKDDHEMFVHVVSGMKCVELAKAALQRTAATMRAIARGQQDQVPRAHEPNSKGALPWQCRYCPVYRQCWGSAIREVEGDASLPKTIIVNHIPTPTRDEINP